MLQNTLNQSLELNDVIVVNHGKCPEAAQDLFNHFVLSLECEAISKAEGATLTLDDNVIEFFNEYFEGTSEGETKDLPNILVSGCNSRYRYDNGSIQVIAISSIEDATAIAN